MVRRFGRRQEQIQFLGPDDEGISCLLALPLGLRPFDPVQHLVPGINSGTRLVLAQQRDGVRQEPNDPAIAHVKLRPKGCLGWVLHGLLNHPEAAVGSGPGTDPFPVADKFVAY